MLFEKCDDCEKFFQDCYYYSAAQDITAAASEFCTVRSGAKDKVLYKALDAGLLAKAEALGSLIDVDRNDIDFNLSDEVMWEYRSPRSGNYFQVRRADGTTMAKSVSLGMTELPPTGYDSRTQFTTIRLNNRAARLITFRNISREESESAGNGRMHGLVIQCA